MYTLFINITKTEGSLELQEDSRKVAHEIFLVDRHVGRRLLEAIQASAKSGGIGPKDIGTIDSTIADDVGSSAARAVAVTGDMLELQRRPVENST